ncbi:MAG: serine/threonine-protein kinase PknK [Myxococcales bacterium]|nr:serine/threonine-protein kinase PknK [Myxococcales bacterium]
MGVVFRAFDRTYRCDVALKTLHDHAVVPDPQATSQAEAVRALAELKAEFRRARALCHDNLVRMHDLVVDEGGAFFTMELVHGQPLDVQTRRSGEAIRAVVGQLLSGLAAVHDAGLLHRDLKPTNLLVEASGRLVILDFGLALRAVDAEEAEAAGTLAYLAPEVLRGRPPSAASDLYAVGVLLLELLTGQLHDPRARPVVRPRDLGSVDADLGALALACLAPDPEERPDVRRAMELLGTPAMQQIGRIFVGRVDELAWLHERLDAGGVVRLQGSAGVGKTALTRQVALRRAMLAGRCHPSESVSFNGLDRIVDAVAARLSSPRTPALRPPPTALAALFPVVREAVGASTVEEASLDEAGRDLARAVAHLGDPVLWIDDVQWLDLDSQRLLSAFVTHAASPVLLTHRPLLDQASLQARDWFAQAPTWALRPLPRDDVFTVARMLQPDGDAQALSEACQGELVWLRRLARRPVSLGAALPDLVREELVALGPEAVEAAATTAVHQGPLPIAVLARSLPESVVLPSALDALISAGLLTRRAADEVDLSHDLLREAVNAEQAASRQRRHLALAEAFAEDRRADSAARHFALGDRPQRAHPFAVQAAEEARARFAWGRAAQLYELAVATRDDPEDALKRSFAQALAAAGRAREAAALRIELGSLEDRLQAAELLTACGAFGEADVEVQRLLREHGFRVPRGRGLSVARGLWWGARARVRPLRLASRQRPDSCLQADVLWTVVGALSQHDPLRAVAFQGQHLHLSLRSGDPVRAARALALQAAFEQAAGVSPRRVRRLLDAARALASPDDADLRAWLLVSHGYSRLLRGEARAALPMLEQAEQHYRATGAYRWERTLGWVYLTIAQYALVRVEELRAMVLDLRVRFHAVDDRASAAMLGLSSEAQLAVMDGDLDASEQSLVEGLQALPTPAPPTFEFTAMVSRVELLRAAGRSEQAYRELQDAWRFAGPMQAFEFPRVVYRHLEASLAISAGGITARALGRAASQMAREGSPLAKLYAAHLRARHARHLGDSVSERRHLDALGEHARSTGHLMFGVSARLRRAALDGDDDEAEASLRILSDRGVRAPELLLRARGLHVAG